MSSLPEAFDSALRNAIGARAVWLPSKPLQVGDVLVRRKDLFHKIAHVSIFGATPKIEPHIDISLDLRTGKVKQRLFQAGVELPDTAGLDLSAEASVKYEFAGESEFILKTPTLSGASIQNMLEIGQKVAPMANWKHDKYFIVEELYSPADWAFVGTTQKNADFSLSGKGSGILSFLSAGASFGLKSSGSADVKIIGKGGPIAMNVVRIGKDGSIAS